MHTNIKRLSILMRANHQIILSIESCAANYVSLALEFCCRPMGCNNKHNIARRLLISKSSGAKFSQLVSGVCVPNKGRHTPRSSSQVVRHRSLHFRTNDGRRRRRNAQCYDPLPRHQACASI
jgi:hypothetical protein